MTITAERAAVSTVADDAKPGPSILLTVGALLDALAAVAVAVPSRPPVPVLGGVVLDVPAGGDRATLAGFDFDTAMSVRLDAGMSAGRAVLSHAQLLKVVKAAVKGETARTYREWLAVVETTQRGDQTDADVTIGGFTVPVQCFRVADYPDMPPQHDAPTFTIDRATLAAMLGKVGPSVGHDETLPMLTGVRVDLAGGRVTVASTDRFRLGVASADVLAEPDAAGGWLLPFGPLAAIVKTLPAGMVTISTGDTASAQWVTVQGGDVSATLRTLDAEFPRYRRLFPDGVTTSVTVDRDALHRTVVKALALVKALDSRIGTITVTVDTGETGPTGESDTGGAVGDGSVTVAPMITESAGRVRGARVPAAGAGAALRFGCNAAYLAEALATFTGDTVALGFNSPNKPVLIADTVAELGDTHAPYRHLLMPTRLPD